MNPVAPVTSAGWDVGGFSLSANQRERGRRVDPRTVNQPLTRRNKNCSRGTSTPSSIWGRVFRQTGIVTKLMADHTNRHKHAGQHSVVANAAIVLREGVGDEPPQVAVSKRIGHRITVSGKHYANAVPDELFDRAAGIKTTITPAGVSPSCAAPGAAEGSGDVRN